MGSLPEIPMNNATNSYLPTSNPTNHFNPLNPEEFRSQAYKMVDFITEYYKRIESYPVLSQVQPGYLRSLLPDSAPDKPQPLDDILNDIKEHIIPGMTHWQSPNFFAYYPDTVSTAAFLGEMMCTAFNSAGFNWLASPAATELEMITMDWLASMLNLPETFMFKGTGGGVLHGTTTEAILCTLNAARDQLLENIGFNNINKLVVYASDQTHSSFAKACKLAGILPNNIRLIPTNHASNFAITVDLLIKAIESDVVSGLQPLYLCVTMGTTSTAAIDPISTLADVAKTYGLWVHVDAAYAGSACICPELRHYLDGVEKVDSLSLNAHKWLLTYLDCCCLWVSKPRAMVHALSINNPEYLKNMYSDSKSVLDYKDWQIGTSRRFRSIRLWMVIRSYGVKNLQDHIRSDIRMANMFEELVRSDGRFEIVVPTRFSLVCFRLNPFTKVESDEGQVEQLNRKLLDWVNSTGQVYMTHTVVGGVYMPRFAVGTTLTQEHHVVAAWEMIKKGADTLLLEDNNI